MPTLIPAASRAMAVFEVFAKEQRALSNSDMARLLQVAESSSSDLLHTLHSLGYLMRTSRTRRFYPTGRLLETARRISETDLLTTICREMAQQLTAATSESAFVGLLDRSAVKLVATQSSPQPLRYVVDLGTRISLHASALGKSLLGLLPRADALELLDAHALRAVTADTVTRVEPLMQQVEASAARGWYEAQGEGVPGVTALAVSGWMAGQPIGISLAGPAARVEHHHADYLRSLRDVRAAFLNTD